MTAQNQSVRWKILGPTFGRKKEKGHWIDQCPFFSSALIDWLRTGSVNGVLNSRVDCLWTISEDIDLGGLRCRVSGLVSDAEGDGVNPSVARSITFGAQLDRLAIGGDNDVVIRVAGVIAIFSLIARDLRDNNLAEVHGAVAVVGCTCHEITDIHRAVVMIRWRQRNGVAIQSNRRRGVVCDDNSLSGLGRVTGTISGGVGNDRGAHREDVARWNTGALNTNYTRVVVSSGRAERGIADEQTTTGRAWTSAQVEIGWCRNRRIDRVVDRDADCRFTAG